MKVKKCLKEQNKEIKALAKVVTELAKVTATNQMMLTGNVNDNVENLSATDFVQWVEEIALSGEEPERNELSVQKEQHDALSEKMHDVKKKVKSVSKDVDAVEKHISSLNDRFKSQQDEINMMVETLIYSLYLQGTVPMSFDNSLKKIHGKVKKKAEKKMEAISILDISK